MGDAAKSMLGKENTEGVNIYWLEMMYNSEKKKKSIIFVTCKVCSLQFQKHYHLRKA